MGGAYPSSEASPRLCVAPIPGVHQENRIVGVSWRPMETYETYGEEGNKTATPLRLSVSPDFLGRTRF